MAIEDGEIQEFQTPDCWIFTYNEQVRYMACGWFGLTDDISDLTVKWDSYIEF